MNRVRIQLDIKGVRELLKSEEVASFLQEKSHDIVSRCNKGKYDVNTQVHNRAVSRVTTADKETYYRNLKNNELLKAMGQRYD